MSWLPSDGPAVVKVWAPWCGSCRALAPIVEEVADSTGVVLVEVQVDDEPDRAGDLAVGSLPTLIALRDGVEAGRLVGLQPIDAVRSLFEVAAGTTEEVRRRTPPSLAAARGLAGVALAAAGLVLASVVLVVLGAAGVGWAAYGLLRR